MEPPTDESQSFSDFRSSAEAVLRLLHERLGFNLWMITRTEGEDWIVLQADDHGYGVTEGTVFRWTDSFCSRMVEGKGPRFAPRSAEVPAYAEAPIGRQVPIGAYIGIPLSRADGSLFGTLCAINPSPVPDAITREQDIVARVGGDEFALLAVECDRSASDSLLRRLRESLALAQVEASLGSCQRHPSEGLIAAWKKADEAMYEEKRARSR